MSHLNKQKKKESLCGISINKSFFTLDRGTFWIDSIYNTILVLPWIQ